MKPSTFWLLLLVYAYAANGQRCEVSSEIRKDFYDADARIWTVDKALLRAIEGNLQLIVDCATSETIRFAEGFVYYAPRPVVISQPIRLEGASSTDGNRSTWTCTEDNHQIISLQNATDVVLQGIHFFNCTPGGEYNSAVTVNNSRVDVANCFFERNRGTFEFSGADGGALSVHGASVITLERSEFFNNSGGDGGAAYFTGTSRGRLSQVNFTENRAASSGGALLLTDDVHVDAEGVIFENNRVWDNGLNKGGAVSLHLRRDFEDVFIDTKEPGLTFNLTNSTCRGNSAQLGGCIYADGNARLEIADSLIFNNSARFQLGTHGRNTFGGWRGNTARLPGEVFSGNGGGICAKLIHSVVLTRVNLTQNTALGKGGGLYMEAQEHTDNLTICRSQLVLDDCTFDGNEATYGGGLHLQDYSVAFANRTQFIRNSASVSGGGVSLQAEDYDSGLCGNLNDSLRYNMRRASFPDAFGRPTIPVRPYFQYFNRLMPTAGFMMENVVFDSNEAVSSGGAVFGEQGVFAYAGYSRFTRNTAGKSGAVYFKQGMFYTYVTVFVENRSPTSGGAVTIDGDADGTEQRSTLVQIQGDTGSSRCEGYFRYTVFAGNTANNYGGAIFVLGTNGHVLAAGGLRFEDNRARAGGAIMASNAAVLLVEGANFTANLASAGGGAIAAGLLEFSQNEVSLASSNFVRNAAARGGAFYGEKLRYFADSDDAGHAQTQGISGQFRRISLNLVTFINNTVEEDGGAFYASELRLRFRGLAIGNRANGNGGAFHIASGSVAALEGAFSQNRGGDGGAISVERSSRVLCFSCEITHNRANTVGGGVSVRAGLDRNASVAFQCDNCTITGNNARRGGGVHIRYAGPEGLSDEALAVFRGTNLSDNIARISGGGVMATHPKNVILNCTSEVEAFTRVWFDTPEFLRQNETERLARLSEKTCPSWTGNTVEAGGYGELRASYAASFMVCHSNDCSESQTELPPHRSTGLVPAMTIKLVDAFDQSPAEPWPEHTDLRVTVNWEPEIVLSGQLSGAFQRGEAFLNQTTVVGHPGEYNITLDFSDARLGNVLLSTALEECKIGEQSVSNNTACQNCSAKAYRISEPLDDCQPCDENSLCDGWGIGPKEDYWVSSPCFPIPQKCLSDDSCSYENRSAELVQYFLAVSPTCDLSDEELEEFRRIQCDETSEGLLCGSCRSDHGRVGFSCYRCIPRAFIVLLLIGGIMWSVVVGTISIAGSLTSAGPETQQQSNLAGNNQTTRSAVQVDVHDSNRIGQEDDSDENGSGRGTKRVDTAKKKCSESLKVLMNFAQVNSTALFINGDWKFGAKKLLSSLNFAGALSVNRVLALDCLFKGTSSVPRSIAAVTLSILLPFVSAFLFVGFWWYRIKGDFQKLKRRIVLSTTVVLYLFYIEWVKQLALVLKCVHIDVAVTEAEDRDRRFSWSADTSVECYTGSHIVLVSALAIPLIIVILVAFPFGSALYLINKRQKKQLDSNETQETFGFLYEAYTERCVFWDICILLRKGIVALVVISASTRGSNLQGLIGGCVLVFFLFLHMHYRPYKEDYKNLNSMESLSLLVCLFTFMFGLFLNDQNVSSGDRIIISFLAVFLIVSFVLYCLTDLYFKVTTFLRFSLELHDVIVNPHTLSIRIVIMWVKLQWNKLRSKTAQYFNK